MRVPPKSGQKSSATVPGTVPAGSDLPPPRALDWVVVGIACGLLWLAGHVLGADYSDELDPEQVDQ